MQDPSSLVAPQLIHHFHLLSSFRYPQLFKADIPKAFEYLRSANSVVSELRPVSWTYLAPPPSNGTVLLEWMSPTRSPLHYPSDGYAWVDPERTSTMEVEGYTMEIFYNHTGFTPESKNPVVMSRYRFRLLAKNPSFPGEEPDPCLWVVLYCRSESGQTIPPNWLASKPEVMGQFQERKTIERLGVLSRKEFMLRDRQNWPTVPFSHPNVPTVGGQMSPASPSRPAGGAGGHHPAVAAQYYQAAQGMAVGGHGGMKRPDGGAGVGTPLHAPFVPGAGGAGSGGGAGAGTATAAAASASSSSSSSHPPAQTQTAGGAGGPTGRTEAAAVSAADEAAVIKAAELFAAATLKEEEGSAAIGDALDQLTARDVSLMRYMRHHEWLEEVLASPFPTTKIVPVDLGLGLAGALSGLTDGLLRAHGAHSIEPVAVARRNGPMVTVVPALPVVGPIGKTTTAEVEDRVRKFVVDGEAEMAEMRRSQAKRMEEMKASKVYGRAEKRVRDLFHGEADDVGGVGGKDEWEAVYDLADETGGTVERLLGVNMVAVDQVVCVSRGGLIDGDPNEPFRSEGERAGMAAFRAGGQGGATGMMVDSDGPVGRPSGRTGDEWVMVDGQAGGSGV